MLAVPLGTYVPGTTVLHRIRPSWKLSFLVVFVIGTSMLVDTVPGALVTLCVPLIGYVVARVPIRIAWQQLWPAAPVLLALFAFQWWQLGLTRATVIVLVIYAAIAAATLLTLTTQISEMMDSLERGLAPTRRFGVPVDTIVLAISLTIRLIPLQLATVSEVLDARKARGVDFSIQALGTPVLIRSIKRARNIGDALVARGVGD
ncbi:energy-coupling factor transporter transmembrane component T family protein [Corynebacterium hindlerae]|uniref:energy-coupling factor transporter transmembrane component T family protein n=1 Tax=Corynebacterium hindlerae TaxID=699041 RepID=UPI003AB04C7E